MSRCNFFIDTAKQYNNRLGFPEVLTTLSGVISDKHHPASGV